MTSTAEPPTPAGWFPDPAGSDQLRWWDGAAWTPHLAPRPAPAQQVAPQAYQSESYGSGAAQPGTYQPAAYQPEAYKPHVYNPAPIQGGGYSMTMEDASPLQWNTVWIWLIIFLPLLLEGISYGALPTLIPALAVSPDPVAALALGELACVAVAIALFITLAYQDRRTLRQWGYANPPSPWWMLISLVYFILRAIRVHRESGHGLAPLFVFIAIGIGSGIFSPILGAAISAEDAPALQSAQTTIMERQFTEVLDSHGGNYSFTCPAAFNFVIGEQFTCTATDLTSSVPHAVALEIVAGSDGKPTVKLISVTPAITN